MHIAYVTSIHPDFDARVWKYATTMVRRGHRVHLICPWNQKDGEMREGVQLHTFPRSRSRATRPLMIPYHILRQLSRLPKTVEVVHFHDLDILPLMAALSLVKPVVYDVHENYPDEMLARQWIPRPMRLPLYHIVRSGQAGLACLVHNTIFAIPEIERHFPKSLLRSEIIRNYATVDLLKQVSPDYHKRQASVVFTGTNYEGNGTLLFLEIAERFKSRNSQLRFMMTNRWADETISARALAFIEARGLTNVSILPNLPPQRLMEHLNRATIGIAPALRQPKHVNALPTKLFEYMAAGLPIVSSDLPNEVCLAGETGGILLSQPEDPESFVSAIQKLVDDRDQAFELGQRGQNAFRERFVWESQTEVLEKFYAAILENRLKPALVSGVSRVQQ